MNNHDAVVYTCIHCIREHVLLIHMLMLSCILCDALEKRKKAMCGLSEI